MLYVQRFQHSRQHHLKNYQSLRSSAGQNFLLCSNQYADKLSRPTSRPSIPSGGLERTPTLLILTRVPSFVSLHNHHDSDLSILNIRATSWNPQQSRITRENKDYMTALAKGLARPDGKQLSNDNAEAFSSRWHHHLSNSVYRPGTGKAGSRGSRPPTSAPERSKTPSSTLIEVNRPTTAPVMIEERPRRIHTAKVKSAAPTRPRAPPSAPLRAQRVFDSSGNFDNLSNATFLHLTEGLKPSIYQNDNHFVHQLCSNANETMSEQLNTNRENFLDLSNGTLLAETTTIEKSQSNETDENDQDENKNNDLQHIINLGTWQRDAKSGRIEAIVNLPSRKTPREDPNEVERRITTQEEQQIRERQNEIDRYTFDHTPDSLISVDDYKSPFTEEYDQAIAYQAQLQTINGNNEWNFKDFYRDVKTKFEQNTNTKAVFEKCIKLARLQANTIKWEQRRRQNMNAYNRLIKTNALDTSTSNLTGSFSSKTTLNNNNNNEKETRELNELKRELRCNECKRIACLGNCAPGQDYHLYKRIVSTIPSQSSPSKQPLLSNGSYLRDQHRCKHGCTTCSASGSSYRTTTADIINANAIMTSLNNNNNNRLRSSKATYSYGQKSQRPPVDLRPRSMYQVTREMKMKFEQANLSPVVVVPLFEDQSRSILNKRTRKKSTNGLLPGKSFRSQRRDSLTLISSPKITS